jgi:hypothetical protein
MYFREGQACIDDAPSAVDAMEANPIVTSPLDQLHPDRLSLLFSIMPKPVANGSRETILPSGAWQARFVQMFSWFTPWRRPRSRDFNFESKDCLPELVTLMPQGEPDFRFALANAWDGSGLAWQWRGIIDSRHVEVQMRAIGNNEGYLGPVHVEGKCVGWYGNDPFLESGPAGSVNYVLCSYQVLPAFDIGRFGSKGCRLRGIMAPLKQPDLPWSALHPRAHAASFLPPPPPCSTGSYPQFAQHSWSRVSS